MRVPSRFLLPWLVLWLPLCLPAGAQPPHTVYKCSAGGHTTYADQPCERGTSVALPPPPVGVDPGVGTVQTGDARTLLEVEKLRMRREQAQAREDQRLEREHARFARANAAQRRKCARHKLRVKWAEEDLGRANVRQHATAEARLRHRREAMAVECPA